MVRPNDKMKIDWETAKRRLREAEKNDPYKVVSTLFKEQKYDRIAAILKEEPDTTVRQNLAIPAALLLVPHLDYQVIAAEMKTRNAYNLFIKHCAEAQKIARKYHVPVHSLDALVGSQNGATTGPDPEYERLYDLYREF